MYIKNRIISLIYKIVTTVVGLSGVLITFGFPNKLNLSTLKFYTMQSNVLCVVFIAVSAVYVVVQMKKSGLYGTATYMPHFKGAVIIAITVTLLVYQFMLADTPFSMADGDIGNFLIHLLTPILVILDWVLFDEKGHYNVFDPLCWAIIPLCYLCYTLIAAPLGVTYQDGRRYPYFFLDVDVLGIGGVMLYVLTITVIVLILSYIIFGLDKWCGAIQRRRLNSEKI